MEQNTDSTAQPEHTIDEQEIAGRNPISADSDTLEPFDDSAEHRQINSDDPRDIAFWADEFQISVAELKAAILLNGSSVREIKKYLSV